MVFLPQVVRDVLAIHDDIVDGDREKFARPTLPAAYTALAPPGAPPARTRHGDHLALYWADLLLGLAADLVEQAPASPEVRCRLSATVGHVLTRTHRGQLTELHLQHTHPAQIPVADLLAMYADKAADYCYQLPFTLGAILGGLDPDRLGATRTVLETVGVASQIIDDIAGGCPQVLEQGKDSIGEITQLRRTVLLCDLARRLPAGDPLQPILAGQATTPEQTAAIREAFLTFGAVTAAATRAAALADQAAAAIDRLGLAAPATAYLHDLVDVRVRHSLGVLTAGDAVGSG